MAAKRRSSAAAANSRSSVDRQETARSRPDERRRRRVISSAKRCGGVVSAGALAHNRQRGPHRPSHVRASGRRQKQRIVIIIDIVTVRTALLTTLLPALARLLLLLPNTKDFFEAPFHRILRDALLHRRLVGCNFRSCFRVQQHRIVGAAARKDEAAVLIKVAKAHGDHPVVRRLPPPALPRVLLKGSFGECLVKKLRFVALAVNVRAGLLALLPKAHL